MKLTTDIAAKFARTALGHVAREYPHKLDHVMGGDPDVLSPRTLHPAFFGSFDWHSCVHGWWTLLTLRRLQPEMTEASQIDALANSTFTREKLGIECAYVQKPEARGFERPYGWGWLLYLHHEAERHEDRRWAAFLEPLAQVFAKRFCEYLKVLTYPITVGTHFNTTFALVLAREWAETRDPVLLANINEWGLRAFGQRRDYQGWEPGGDEFLSPVLTVALLMNQVMPAAQFGPWLDDLILANGWLDRDCYPVTVSDRSDGKIAHLDGLNLSRAWCLNTIATKLPTPETKASLRQLADRHFTSAIDHVTGDYMGEHWLASFALLAMLSHPDNNPDAAHIER